MAKVEFNLSADDIKTLTEILENTLSGLSFEISRTDSWHFRDMLRTRRNSLQNFLNQLFDKKGEQNEIL